MGYRAGEGEAPRPGVGLVVCHVTGGDSAQPISRTAWGGGRSSFGLGSGCLLLCYLLLRAP